MDTDRIRAVLNVLFMIGALISVILYFTLGEDKTVFFLCVRCLSFPENDGIRVSFLSTINYRRINYDKRRYNQT